MRGEREKEALAKVKLTLKDITCCLEYIGIVNPLNKVYNLTKDLDYFPLVAALITINVLS